EIFEVNEQGQKQWIQNWETYLYLGYKKVVDEVDIISLEDLRVYPVGDTKKVTTVTQIVKGKDPDELFYPDEPIASVRKMAVLGTVLNGCEDMAHDIGCTHIIGNGYYWGDYDLFESLGGKSIINLKPKPVDVPTKDFIRRRIDEWIARPGCGGWWIDNGIRGEEPDAQPNTPDDAKKMLEDRQWFYRTVREYDTDIINHPVVEQFNMTEQGVVAGAWRSGWKGQYSESPMTCDVNLWTCYTAREGTGAAMYAAQARWFDAFIVKYMTGKVQLIPQISLQHYWQTGDDNSVKAAYRNWKKIMADHGLEIGGLAYYSDSIIRANGQAQNAIREVNKLIK
ncbi:hypothetical protein LCGC14_2522990, partial [marine sediment metagenome]